MKIEGEHYQLERHSGYVRSALEPEPVGLDVVFKPIASSVGPTAHLSDMLIMGPYATGARLRHCWNATLEDFFVFGVLTEAENQNPTAMQIAIDIGNSMDVNLLRPRITTAKVGILAGDPAHEGRAEGLDVNEGFLMHVETGVKLLGKMGGGWPTPSAEIHPRHINFLQYGIFAQLYVGLQIRNINMYASHYRTGQWGCYLVGCKNVQIDAIDFWANRRGFYGAIVLDACEDVYISGGTIDQSVTIALHATASCKNIYTSGPQWDKAKREGKVVNRAQGAAGRQGRQGRVAPPRYRRHLPPGVAA